MQQRGETALVDAIVDARERDAVRIAARMLRTGTPMGIVEGICAEAMQKIGKGFTSCPECIDEVVAADRVVEQIVRPEMFAQFETQSALAPNRSMSLCALPVATCVATFVAAPLANLSQPPEATLAERA